MYMCSPRYPEMVYALDTHNLWLPFAGANELINKGVLNKLGKEHNWSK